MYLININDVFDKQPLFDKYYVHIFTANNIYIAV